MGVLAVALTALGVSVTSPVLVIPLLRRHKVIDIPGYRSLHRAPVVRGVGAAVALGVGAAWAAAVLLGSGSLLVAAAFGVGLAVAAVGLVEDVHGLGVGTRIAAQMIIGVGLGLVCSAGNPGWWVIPSVALGMAGYVNAANFMDGVDSISGLHGVVAGAYFCLLGGLTGHPWLQLTGGVCAAGFAGFLPWNLVPKVRVFLGDVGSYLLGGLVGGCAVLVLSFTDLGVLLAVAPLLVYVVDTASTVARRAVRGDPLTEAHRSHVYQQLAAGGWPHVVTGVVVAIITALCCVAALLVYWAMISTVVAVVWVVALLAGYLALPSLVSNRDQRTVTP